MRRALLVSVLVFATTASADVLRILDDPSEAAQARVDVIQQAGSEINALYFLARDDRVTMTALALLRDAQRRGVVSRLIVDAHFHHIPKSVLAHLRDEGVEVKVYHPLTLRHPSWIFRRMHEKLVVVDGARFITGGRNLAEAYFGLAKKNYVDRDVYVEGASASDADAHFEELWSSIHVARLRVRVSANEKRRAAERLDALMKELREGSSFVRLDTGRDWASDGIRVQRVRFFHDPVNDRDGTRVGARMAEIFERATESIVIESPYFVPSRALRALLERKRAQGVRVQIVTNSFRSTDGLLPYAGYLKYGRRLVRHGVDVREYKGPDMLHAKSAVIDGRIVVIGSYNMDPRSHHLDLEAICVAEDERLAAQLRAAIDEHARNAWKVESAPRVPPAQALSLGAMRLILPLVEGQL